MTLEQALFGAVTCLAGCVGFLFRWFKAQFAEIVTKLNDCEEDRLRLWEKISQLGNANSTKPSHEEPVH